MRLLPLASQVARVDYIVALKIKGFSRANAAKIVHVWFGQADASQLSEEYKQSFAVAKRKRGVLDDTVADEQAIAGEEEPPSVKHAKGAPKAPKVPKVPKAPKVSKVPKAPKVPKVPKAPKAPRAPVAKPKAQRAAVRALEHLVGRRAEKQLDASPALSTYADEASERVTITLD